MTQPEDSPTPVPRGEDATPKLAARPPGDRWRPTPRLQIWHFMLWIACCAAMLALWRLPLRDERPLMGDTFNMALITIQVPAAGASLASLVLLFLWRRARIPFPIHPGEWLLVLYGAHSVLGLGLYFLMQWIEPASLMVFAGYAILTCWFNLLPALSVRGLRRWTFFFWIALAGDLVEAGAYCLTAMTYWSTTWMIGFRVATGLLVLCVVAFDVRDRSRFAWTHWVGVAVYLWGTLLAIGWTAYIWLQNR